MEFAVSLLKAFAVGGTICAAVQIIIDLTALSPGRILTALVVTGVVLTAFGVYEPLVSFAGAGATVPLTGFGYTMAKGVEESVAENGLIGALTGPLSSASGGITAAILAGLTASLLAKPKEK